MLIAGTGISRNPHMYGDLLLTPKQEKLLNIDGRAMIQGFKDGINFWPNRIVPYQLDSRLSKCHENNYGLYLHTCTYDMVKWLWSQAQASNTKL